MATFDTLSATADYEDVTFRQVGALVCDHTHDSDHEPIVPPELAAPSRRSLLRWAGVGGIGILTGGPLLGRRNPAYADTFTGSQALLAAMHVHGSQSEQEASWASYGPVGQGLIDVLFMTDHNYRAQAYGFWQNLEQATLLTQNTGTFAQQSAGKTGGSVRMLAESASTTAPATTTMRTDDKSWDLWDHLRTAITGHTLRHTFGASLLTGGATYEVQIRLSHHPAEAGRPAGQYELWYRFGAGVAAGRGTENGGLRGVVTCPLPASGTTVAMDLEADAVALWGNLYGIDNSFNSLAFVVRSPAKGSVADIQMTALTFERVRHDVESIRTQQRLLADTYSARFGFTYHPAVEGNQQEPHINYYTSAQYFPDEVWRETMTLEARIRRAVYGAHARGGLASWNHPFGASEGAFLSPAEQTARRRTVFANMLSKGVYGCDILEVGYAIRGGVGIEEHLGLWDTFSRRAWFLTGNGVNDDHRAGNWRSTTRLNGFATGIWAPSTSHAALMTALRSGRAYTAHAGKWPRGQLDLMVDGTVPMGAVSVASKTSRNIDIQAANLPSGSQVELVRGPVDYTGNNPGTSVIATVAASAFGATGVVRRAVSTTTGGFFRTQVRNSSGELIGASNPVWLLSTPPPTGIPVARRA